MRIINVVDKINKGLRVITTINCYMEKPEMFLGSK